jgi:DNA polymerase epsilon subunit 1
LNYFDLLEDIREYDVPYHVRFCIDKGVNASKWYKISFSNSFISKMEKLDDMTDRPDYKILAYDIETTKLPLKFPDARYDYVMMISYVVDGEGFLIVNRSIISKDVEEFDYTPTQEFAT